LKTEEIMPSRLLAAVMLAALLSLTPPLFQPAAACQIGCVPIHLILTPLPGITNAAPPAATGVAELVLAESEVRGSVAGLPPLTDEVYVAWLINTHTDEALPFGAFNTDQEQRGQFRFILEQTIPNRGWNLFLITIGPREVDGPRRQGDRRGIGAFFPGADPAAAPLSLPNTGGPTPTGLSQSTAAAPASVADAAPGRAPVTISPEIVAVIGLAAVLMGWRARQRRRS
jgi:hypothetical protein